MDEKNGDIKGDSSELATFLENNKLNDIKSVLLSKFRDLNELIKYESKQMKSLLKSNGINDVLTIKRFIKAIDKIKPNKKDNKSDIQIKNVTYNDINIYDDISPIMNNKIISKDENDKIVELYKQYNILNGLSNNIERGFVSLSEATNMSILDIEKLFEKLIILLNNKRERMINECDYIKKCKELRIKSQLEYLKEYKKLIKNGQKQYDNIMNANKINTDQRKKVIQEMKDVVLNYPGVIVGIPTMPDINACQFDNIYNEFSKSLKINDCDIPGTPHIKIKKCEFSSISVEWTYIYIIIYYILNIFIVFLLFRLNGV